MQALAHGFAVLAVESKNRSRNGRCFSSAADPLTSDQFEAPYVIQVWVQRRLAQQHSTVHTGSLTWRWRRVR